MIKTETYKLRIILLSPLLGSQPGREIAEEFIAKRAGIKLPEDEALMLPELLERGTSVFHRQPDESPCLMNYHLLGFLKEAGKVLNNKIGVKALRNKISMYVTITPRIIPLILPAGETLDYFERPLRIEGMFGPRVTIARSEMAPAGTWFFAGLEVIDSEITQPILEDLLSYGFSHGLGQFRGSGAFGTFAAQLEKEVSD